LLPLPVALTNRHEEHNKMGPQNVSIVFGPTLLRQTNADPMADMRDSSYQSAVVEQILSRLEWYLGIDDTL
jgi:hypothetical protein